MDDPDLGYLINHVFMPLKLPQHDEQGEDDFRKDHSLAQFVVECAEAYQTMALDATDGKPPSSSWTAILRMLQGVEAVHGSHNYTSEHIAGRLATMRPDDVTVILVRQQNAGLLVRLSETEAVFEVFEASASNIAVMNCEKKLVWSFPGPCTSIPRSVFDNAHFRDELSSYLAHMNRDTLPGSAPHSKKAGSSSVEIRDTAHPRYISDLLLVILAATGGSGNTIRDPARRVEKRIQDDVLWCDAFAPWRRSSLWLVIRVALQTTLEHRWEYKAFMAYLMSSLAGKVAKCRHFDPPTLDCMRKKLARRAQKLDELEKDVPTFVLEKVSSASCELRDELDRRWLCVQEEDRPTYGELWAPETLDVAADIKLKLMRATPYIDNALQASHSLPSSSFFSPAHPARLRDHTIGDIIGSQSLKSFVAGADAYIGLADFENMVRDDLRSWTSRHLHSSQAVSNLGSLIKAYYGVANPCYNGNAEQQSLMILTILDLWVAHDKIAVSQYPLLAEYPPEVPLSLFEPLLVRRSSELQRIVILAKYLQGRWDVGNGPSVFSPPSDASIATLGYDRDPAFDSRKQVIENLARTRRDAKEAELETKNQEYERLKRHRNSLAHDLNCGHWRAHCARCSIQKQLDNMIIEIYEWPLPRDSLMLKTVVFELYCPRTFAAWRETTYQLLHDVFTTRTEDVREVNDQLCLYISSHVNDMGPTNRITLGSTTKSWLRTHYKCQTIPSTTDDVCKPHGLTWVLYDSSNRLTIGQPNAPHAANVYDRCTLLVPRKEPYNNLQWSIGSTVHTENWVLSQQHTCHRDLSLHEFVTFASLRAGGHVQWMNIARAFVTRSLSFRFQAVHVLVSQAVQQHGETSESASTLWHLELESPKFCQSILSAMVRLVESFKENWQEVASVKTVILVVARMLASLGEGSVHAVQALEILSQARKITDRWLSTMLESLERTAQEHIESAKGNIREVAATCALTFDIDNPDLSADNLAILFHSLLVLRDNREAQRDRSSSSTTRILLDRVERMFHNLELRISDSVISDPRGLNVAVKRVWPAYMPGSPWKAMGSLNNRWMMCRTTTSQYVQVNFLDGTLLVDGKPIGNLPSQITEHQTYTRLFGTTVLRAVPAGEAGLEYKTVKNVSGHQVFFAIQDDDLVVQARLASSDRRERYIPHNVFDGDLPYPLVDLVHWLDLETKQIELRPVDALWSSTSNQWTLDFPERTMSNSEQHYLLDVHSRSVSMIGQRLEPIESLQFLIMTTHNSVIDVQLPRLQLHFRTSVSESQRLLCVTFSDCYVDEHPEIGTLIGLRSKLVLREQSADDDTLPLPIKRRLIIPYGHLTSVVDNDHVVVTLDKASTSSSFVEYAEYAVKGPLGMLSGLNLRSHLFRVLLHAMTSYPLPDPFTGHTGIEESLNILGSAACTSFQFLNSHEEKLLRKISMLTPRRQFYPERMAVMQKIRWSESLPLHSQLTIFHILVRRILLSHNQMAELFYPAQTALSLDEAMPCKLFERAASREYSYPLVNLQSMPPETRLCANDVSYASRVAESRGDQDECHYSTALMVYTLSASRFPLRPQNIRLYDIFRDWETLQLQNISETLLHYDSDWLAKDDFNVCWADLYRSCTNPALSIDKQRFSLLFSLSAFAFEHRLNSNTRLLPYLVLLTRHSRCAGFPTLPPHALFDLTVGLSPSAAELESIITGHVRPVHQTPSQDLEAQEEETWRSLDSRRAEHHSGRVNYQKPAFLRHLQSHWNPSLWPTSIPPLPRSKYFDRQAILDDACILFQKCRANVELHDYAENVNSILCGLWDPQSPALSLSRSYKCANAGIYHPTPVTTNLAYLLCNRPAPGDYRLDHLSHSVTLSGPDFIQKDEHFGIRKTNALVLRDIVNRVGSAKRPLHKLYAEKMLNSLDLLEKVSSTTLSLGLKSLNDLQTPVANNLTRCSEAFDDIGAVLSRTLRPDSMIDNILDNGGLWPSSNTRALLHQMTQPMWAEIDDDWRKALAILSCALLQWQQAVRLSIFLGATRKFELQRELENCGAVNEELVLAHPDWALIQIEGDVRARDIQLAVAQEMYSPQSGKNISLQLNMGEGKSSMIAPMLAASLSNGCRLVRMVVLKSLAPQMFQLLCERLAGLVNRQVFFLPYSRQLKFGGKELRQIRELAEFCMRTGGVLVSQPEHILSARLLAIEKMTSGGGHDEETTREAVRFERLQHVCSCDILDESDELLHPRYQLIYTMGNQVAVEGHPTRWLVCQEVLGLVARHIRLIDTSVIPESRFEVHSPTSWSFPHFKLPVDDDQPHILATILKKVVTEITDQSLLSSLNTAHLSPDMLLCIRRFIASDSEAEPDQTLIEQQLGQGASLNALLLLRGLFGYGLLSYVMRERRWRIDYGLDTSRTPPTLLAVPYRAKDMPSLRAEFGHPDIAILLTCLSYYYTGLTVKQVDACFSQLFLDSNPIVLYETWIHAIPPRELDGLSDFGSININDTEQHARIVELFHNCQAVIDFYLRTVVFPKAAKEFPKKLPTSAWDLAERKRHITSGFSGTNDNEYLLPTSISQVDPVRQGATNAMVLTYLLQGENANYTCTCANASGKSMPGQDFIGLLAHEHHDIRVLLDIGAQMLDMGNKDVARTWLSKHAIAEAAVFFDSEDELTVVKRDGTLELLKSSPYRQRLFSCIVYLDDAHTRGTDLKLPINWKAAVTLGRKMTKDRLVQGCMRMRQLGHGQSLHFFAQPDIDALIKKACNIRTISIADIIHWTMLETCADIEHHGQQWARQGPDFKRRRACLDSLPANDSEIPTASDIESVWLQREARTLKEMYGASPEQVEQLDVVDKEIRDRLELLGITRVSSHDVDEEQEREVDHEMEVERQVDRPPPRSAADHQLHVDVRRFACTGQIPPSSPAFCSPFQALRPLRYSSTCPPDLFHRYFLVTRDYAVTVSQSHSVGKGSTEFMKDTQWLLCARGPPTVVVVISQFEANELVPLLRGLSPASPVNLHVYAPRVTRNMQSFDSLNFYSIPARHVDIRPVILPQLGIFAAQLYPVNFVDFKRVCAFLGLATTDDDRADVVCEQDGFVRGHSLFEESPVPFVQELVATRRKGQDHSLTPMGKLLRGVKLYDGDME